jgi:hypothetical protein
MSVSAKPPTASSGLANWFKDALNAGGTGGFHWHLQARMSLPRWQATQTAIAHFLAQVAPVSDHLLLLGGSAGWMMPPSWLQRFRRIDAYDIDPLAPPLFKWRHGKALQAQGIEIQFHRLDAIANLPALLRHHPQACLWFDNLLGQLRYRLGDEEVAERQLGQLQHLLKGRHWGSLHDMYSGPTDAQTPLQRDIPQLVQAGQNPLNDEGLQALLRKVDAKGIWQDHATRVVFPSNTPTTWIPWAFRPHYWHWLEAGWVTP